MLHCVRATKGDGLHRVACETKSEELRERKKSIGKFLFVDETTDALKITFCKLHM